MPSKNIPITVFTGFLGAGKTSIILSLLPRLPKDYKVVLLKNEFGDVEVDSQLAKQSSLAAVSEILNGCMCCVLVGQMKNALLEIREKYRPDRIIIECSGSAFPATLAFQIRELERETANDLKLDAIVTVIDAENFAGYEDTSPTAKMQASYTDVILINKWEHISERQLDILIDHLNTLNDTTPKVKCQGRAGVDPALVFGLDSTLFQLEDRDASAESAVVDVQHHDEVETVTLLRGYSPSYVKAAATHEGCGHADHSHCNHAHAHAQAQDASAPTDDSPIVEEDLTTALSSLSKETVWRVKGFVRLARGLHILNWAFGRYELTAFDDPAGEHKGSVKLTVMGERGEVKRAARRLAERIGAQVVA
ncbi:cobW-domain-containing protein [Cubamyces sp. BRFM 1775]|nr:cobW-domain-containing protein [Cubamyces sp. BRFM 1775]